MFFEGQSMGLKVEYNDLVDEGQKLRVECDGIESRHTDRQQMHDLSQSLRYRITRQRRQRRLRQSCPSSECATQVSIQSFASFVFVSVALATNNNDEEMHLPTHSIAHTLMVPLRELFGNEEGPQVPIDTPSVLKSIRLAEKQSSV